MNTDLKKFVKELKKEIKDTKNDQNNLMNIYQSLCLYLKLYPVTKTEAKEIHKLFQYLYKYMTYETYD